MIWWLAGGVVLVLLVLIGVRGLSTEDRKTVSWWAARNGFRYTKGSFRLFHHLTGMPFDRGTGQDAHDVLSGAIAGVPGLIVGFSWYRLPTGDGPSGLHSGICVAAVLDLPAPVPELVVRRETRRDLGRDLQLESEAFNDAFRVTGTHDRFSYDVLNPRVMELMLANPEYGLRIGGSTLAVWRDGQLDGTTALGELRDLAATLYGLVPGFVYTSGYPATASPRVGEIPPADLGETPTGTIHMLQHVAYRGHEIERYEYRRKLWGVTESAVSVKINVPTVWPVLMIAAKEIATARGRQPRFDDGVTAGHPDFDDLFACGTPRPDFASLALTREFTDLMVARPDTRRATVIFQSELLTPADDGVAEDTRRGGLWVSAPGELNDQDLVNRLTELACDLVEAVAPEVVGYHVDEPVREAPEGGWGNTLPGYYVRPRDRM